MSSKKRAAAAAVKVVLMDTQYVEADPMNFKSVVQKLTGKDSSVAWIKESNNSSAVVDGIKREISVKVDKLDDGVEVDQTDVDNNNNRPSVSILSKGLSFKDLELDRWITEVPPPDELQLWWTEYNFN
ncbi:VQ motif-containing protein [Melia azedarach]|uniref:VQ motif-containing protein n=1 Tax=Melia azedarach TaxID=155640 RepID=A0ACC1WZV2_MELAZ|nr:VQ motif-containing protein [Melia azedarach]